MATSKSKVVDIVETMDGTMSVNHDSTTVPAAKRIHEVELYTPAGLAWSATDTHTMILRYPGGPIDWDDVLAEVQKGTVPCDLDCEWDSDCDLQRPPPPPNYTIIWFKAGDRSYDLTIDEAARRFWETGAAQEWLANPTEHLRYLTMRWLSDNIDLLSSRDNHVIYAAVYAAKPAGSPTYRSPSFLDRWMAILPKDPDERQAIYDTINRARRNK